MRTSDFDYDLPEEAIAQEPSPIRDECKMLVMDRVSGALTDTPFHTVIDHLDAGDVLIANETRVMPARLIGKKRATGGVAEVFLLRELPGAPRATNTSAVWEALVRPGRRLKPGAIVEFCDDADRIVMHAEIIDWVEDAEKGERIVKLTTPCCATLDEALHLIGHTPLPPYIKHYAGDESLYQTVYATREKSAAAPTAGLHFTPELIARIQEKGVGFKTVELEVGLDTFRVVEEDDPTRHKMHTESYRVPQNVVDTINEVHERGNRVIAVGTTSLRSLESAWDDDLQTLRARDYEKTSLFVLPGYPFHVVDALITNFHVPRSTLMMLVSAFSTRENIMNAYAYALENGYRFLSFGDAMFIR